VVSTHLGNGNGGGVLSFGDSGTLTLTNSTFSGNSAGGYGGGLRIRVGTAALRNTIVANSTSGGNCSGPTQWITHGGNHMDSGTTCGWGTNSASMSNTDPLPGASTGSPAYFPLNAGSRAIDAGNDAICAATPVSNDHVTDLVKFYSGNANTAIRLSLII
jgi:hypothetical protein